MVQDRIYSSTPIDRVAVRVAGKGYEYRPDKKIQTADQPTPIPTRKVPESIPDITGLTRGRLTVIGLARDTKKRWVVRCNCGTYSLRTAKAMKNEENVQDRCEHCRHLAHLKRSDHYRSTGRDRDIREY
ncbi:hypothetical protein [Thalassospira povalilytica]|uniref:hypothetical protein n=1 Tax=Thalassospira povalilytica TaxID=732237 RepID=UPI001D182EBC|nr:hypothetical protein [Thalassospira povalilytica]MCC4240338.1 hypothetical protein [Thalassospira povalilytica]